MARGSSQRDVLELGLVVVRAHSALSQPTQGTGARCANQVTTRPACRQLAGRPRSQHVRGRALSRSPLLLFAASCGRSGPLAVPFCGTHRAPLPLPASPLPSPLDLPPPSAPSHEATVRLAARQVPALLVAGLPLAHLRAPRHEAAHVNRTGRAARGPCICETQGLRVAQVPGSWCRATAVSACERHTRGCARLNGPSGHNGRHGAREACAAGAHLHEEALAGACKVGQQVEVQGGPKVVAVAHKQVGDAVCGASGRRAARRWRQEAAEQGKRALRAPRREACVAQLPPPAGGGAGR